LRSLGDEFQLVARAIDSVVFGRLDLASSAKLHIVHLTAPARFGGLEAVVAALAAGAARRGHTVQVISLLGLDPMDRCAAFEPLTGSGVHQIEIRLAGRSYRTERHRVGKVLAPFPEAIVHSHGYHADLVGFWATRSVPNRIVSTVHGFTGGRAKNQIYEWLDRQALRRFDAVVPVSLPLVDRLALAGVPRDRVHLIPNGYAGRVEPLGRAAARAELGLPADAPVVGWIGRLSREKAPDVFLEASGRAGASVRASVIGNGVMRSALEAQAAMLGIAERVHWHGELPGAARFLPAFDVLMMTSRTEGTPIVLLEAMAAGIPVIVTAVGGIPDVVTDREAVLVPSEHPDLLAQAIDDLFRSPEAARTRAERAKTRLSEQFGAEPWLDRYERVYTTLTRAGRRST
jgi:glycosyltransferase involved in cell wall biosynthesis